MLMVTLLAFCNISEAGDSIPAVTGIEGIKWLLVEVSGAPVSPLAGEKQPHLRLDPVQKKVTRFAGCNNFFGSYELDGASLKFGPAGSTRMACPDLETGLETEFLIALDKTGGWEIKECRHQKA
jgi:heat shock protein HslJ